jgi:hypothetical protein
MEKDELNAAPEEGVATLLAFPAAHASSVSRIAADAPAGFAVEARIRDTDLGKRLGYDRPENIRTLVSRNRSALDAMGSLLQFEAVIEAGKGATRRVTEFHLNQAQAAYLISKARTKNAESMAIVIAEVFAMFTQGQLASTSQGVEQAIRASVRRHAERVGVCPVEERDARHEAFQLLRRRRPRRSSSGGFLAAATASRF